MKPQSNLTVNYPSMPELTARGMILGALITVIFTASNVYLGLKVGLTFSSSIPAAVISMAILRMFKHSNILENNMVQTQASAAGTLSAIIFILPGLLMLGYWQGFPFWQTLLLCACGGSLGVLFTIPLRRAMVVNSDLPYPEGRAAAEILKVGSEIRKEEANGEDTSKKETGMKDIVGGTALAGLFSLCSNGFHVVSSEFSYWLSFGKAVTQIPLGFSTALLGAGYLIGIASGMAILVGTLLAWYVFVPYLTSVITPAEGQSAAAFAKAIWAQKVRFIGAGCIGIAAVWTLIRLAKPVVDGIKMSINAFRSNDTDEKKLLHHTDIDMSPKSIAIVFFCVLLGLIITFYSFVGAAWFDPVEKFEKIKVEDLVEDGPQKRDATGGWIAMLQHHFALAWIPDRAEPQDHALLRRTEDGDSRQEPAGERETRRDLPGDVRAQSGSSVAIRETLERLEHEHGCDHIAGHRRPTPP